jgi:hypothetical protein
MDGTRAAHTEDQCLSSWCSGGKEVGGKISARFTLPASSMVEVIWHQHAYAYEPQRLNEHYY